SRTLPVDGLAEPRRVLGRAGEVAGDRRGVIGREHLEAHRGATARRDQPAQQAGLDGVVLGIVVPLAQQDEPRGGETAGEVGRGDEAVGSDVPDCLCQGVVPPRRTQPPRQRCATRCREERTLLAASCGTPLTWWLSPTGRNHPLAEIIWDVRGDGFVTPSDLAGRLAAARFVLLG